LKKFRYDEVIPIPSWSLLLLFMVMAKKVWKEKKKMEVGREFV
jgi:hypothetical protein